MYIKHKNINAKLPMLCFRFNSNMCQRILCFLVNIWIFLSDAIERTNNDIHGQTIICGYNDDCIIYCDINNGGNCQNANIICHNTDDGLCELTCIGKEACRGLSIHAFDSRSVKINCGLGNGIIYYVFLFH